MRVPLITRTSAAKIPPNVIVVPSLNPTPLKVTTTPPLIVP
jgi:hypothetical protein